ncbi:MAG: helix-turn-helix domain-containing protein [Alphaproteobacteria bacterium]|nr:helix-turn-helix domain-containing protein [Alphaproteobacteria bacterium]
MNRYNYFGDYDEDEREAELTPNEYLTPREVMDLLYIGKNTFYRLVNSGELPAFRIGKLWRVRREDVELYCRNKHESQR